MSKTVSINENRDFLRVYKRGKFFVGRYFVLYSLGNSLDFNRIGITTSRKIGNSVKRNRIKRLVKESLRHEEENIKSGYDLVIVARNNPDIPDYKSVRRELNFLLKKLKLYN